jgi:hypothetical protein
MATPRRARRLSAVSLGLLYLLFTSPRLGAQLVISEFMAENHTTLNDEDGDSSDWIEIHNLSAAPVDLDGWFLTDDPLILQKWAFPAQLVASGGYMVVFASGKNRSVTGSELHTNFSLDAGGEFLALVEPDGVTPASAFSPRYPAQREDVSFGHGQEILGSGLVDAGAVARALAPASDALGLSWTGGQEPFDDAPAAGWSWLPTGLGYPLPDPGARLRQPLAYYSFDAGTKDESGNGNDGTAYGAVSSADVPARIGGGRSLEFDGADDFVSAPLDVSESSFSSSLWFRADSSNRGIFTVVDQDLGAGGYDRLLYLSGSNIAGRVWNNETVSSSGRNYADRAWHHLAHVCGATAGGQRIYVDGVLVASGAKAQSDFDWQEHINIGFSNDASSPYFDGRIDDVSVWSEALDAATIAKLAAGASPMAIDGVAPLVRSDLAGLMRNRGASVYVRIPFTLSLPVDFDALQLHLQYEDGLAAYLNGVEVARRNAPAALSSNSAATADRLPRDAVRAEVIDLSGHLGLLRDGVNVLAFHGLNSSAASDDFLLLPRLVRVRRTENRYLIPATPGDANVGGVLDFVDDTTFSVDRGLFTAPFDVAIATSTPGAAIYYTLNGSAPSPENPAARLYSAPIRISTTTTLRAAAFKEGFQPTNVDTHTYLFHQHVRNQPANPPGLPATWSGGFPADYEVDRDVVNTTRPGYSFDDALLSLPTVSVVADPADLFGSTSGIYYYSEGRGLSWERPASIEYFDPDGEPGFQENAGIRMHGNSSRYHGFTPKHPIRVMFRRKYGAATLKFPLFGIERFDQLLLRGASTDSWPVVTGDFVLGVQRWNPLHATYIRDQYMRDALMDIGQPACGGTYVQLYLNGLYWGLYNLAERPVDSFNAEHLGGEKEEYDVLKDFAELQAGNATAWNQMITLASAGLSTDAAYQRIQGRNPDGTPNPAYPRLLDVDNLIDYMILHIHAGAEDWPDHNWWAARRRGPESDGFKFFPWDQEISNDSLIRTHTRIATRFEQPIGSASPSFLYGRLNENAGHRRKFMDRVHALLFNDGPLSPAKNYERWMRRQNEVDKAMVGESARWGDSKKAVPYKREVEWLNEMNWMRDAYWPGVQPLAIQRFRNVRLYPNTEAPVFHVNGAYQHGGPIGPGDRLSMSVPDVEIFVERAFVARDAPATAIVPVDDRLGLAWTQRTYVEGANGETWRSGTQGVGYETGAGYETVIGLDVEDAMFGAAGNNTVYVRIRFNIPDAAALSGFEELTLKAYFDDGFIAYLNGVKIAEASAPAAPAWNSGATAGGEASLDAPALFDVTAHAGRLRVGDNLLAVHGMNFSNTSSDMLAMVELVGRTRETGLPPGLVRYTIDGSDPMDAGALEYTSDFALDGTTRVKARASTAGEWSALNEAVYVDPSSHPIRVTEIMYHPPEPVPGGAYEEGDYEFLELQNTGSGELDLAGIRVSGAIEFDFSSGAVPRLPPQGVVLLVKNLEAFSLRYPVAGLWIAGEYAGKLDNAGERLTLLGPMGETLLAFDYDDLWYPETDGQGRSLVFSDPYLAPGAWTESANWAASADLGGTPGTTEGGPGVEGGWQRPGDSNQDGLLDLSDAVSMLFRLFAAGDRPLPCQSASLQEGANLALLDVNGDGSVDIADPLRILNYVFKGGAPPSAGRACVRIDGCPNVCFP